MYIQWLCYFRSHGDRVMISQRQQTQNICQPTTKAWCFYHQWQTTSYNVCYLTIACQCAARGNTLKQCHYRTDWSSCVYAQSTAGGAKVNFGSAKINCHCDTINKPQERLSWRQSVCRQCVCVCVSHVIWKSDWSHFNHISFHCREPLDIVECAFLLSFIFD